MQIAYHRCSPIKPAAVRLRSPSEASIVMRRFRSRPWSGILTDQPCECIDPNHRFHQSCVLGNHLDLTMSATTAGIVPALSGVLPAYRCI